MAETIDMKGKVCSMCDKELMNRYTHKSTWSCTMIGNKYLCNTCHNILWGLEDYYDLFDFRLMKLAEVKQIIKNIHSDDKLLNKIKRIRKKGDYIPNYLINEIKGITA